jgi:hypothetical protein
MLIFDIAVVQTIKPSLEHPNSREYCDRSYQPMSALGQNRTFALQYVMSALAPTATAKADIRKRPCPLYPRKRTCAVQLRMSALGQKRTVIQFKKTAPSTANSAASLPHDYCACCALIAFSICAFTASRLKLAPFCIGGNSNAVWASVATCRCTNTKRQNS